MGRQTVTTQVWYLEMTGPDQLRAPSRPQPSGLEIAEVSAPPAAYVRFFYAAVGRDYGWTDRLEWDEPRWQDHLQQAGVRLVTAAVDAVPAGFALLVPGRDGGADSEAEPKTGTRAGGEMELEYVGLLPGWTGRGIGGALLHHACALAWNRGASRLWLHTCSLDSPAALPSYERRGFRVYRKHSREQVVFDRTSSW